MGETHTRWWEEGWGEPIQTKGQTLWYSRYLYRYYDTSNTFSLKLTLKGTVSTKETRERWPQLTVETKVNGDSESTNERGPSLVGSLGMSCRYKKILILHWLL